MISSAVTKLYKFPSRPFNVLTTAYDKSEGSVKWSLCFWFESKILWALNWVGNYSNGGS